MPNCFSLVSKATREAETFSEIDDKMCTAIGVPCDPVHFYLDWYDMLGFGLACGKDWAWFRDIVVSTRNRAAAVEDAEEVKAREDVLKVIDWLDANYTVDAWVEVGKVR